MKTLNKKEVNELVEVTPNEVWVEVLKQISELPEDFLFNYDNTLYTSSYKISNVYNIHRKTLNSLLSRYSSVFAKDGVISVEAKTLKNSLELGLGVSPSHDPSKYIRILTPKAIARVLLFLTENEAGDKLKKYIFQNFEDYKMQELTKEKRKETNKKNKPSTVGVRFKTHEQKNALENFAKDNNLTLSSALYKIALQCLTDNGYLQYDSLETVEAKSMDVELANVLDDNLSDKEYEMIQNISDEKKVSIKEAYKIYQNTLNAN